MTNSEARVTHVIIGLGRGGAETMLYQVIKYRTPDAPEYRVISLGLSHAYEKDIMDVGAELVELDLRKHPLSTMFRLKKELKSAETIVCWTYIACMLSYMVTGKAKHEHMVWCIRHSDLNKKHISRTTRITSRMCAVWSKNIPLITYNGEQSRRNNEAYGFRPKRSMVLSNGLDTEQYKPDDFYRYEIRRELGLSEDKQIVLSVANYTAIKDVPGFVKAFAIIHKKLPNTVAVMCGIGIDDNNDLLMEALNKNCLKQNEDVYILGVRSDINRIYVAADLYILHSLGEAFPNNLIQAMASGALCVATDVGDAKKIMGYDDYIVEPGDHEAMAGKTVELLKKEEAEKAEISEKNRAQIIDHYDIKNVVKEYEEAFAL